MPGLITGMDEVCKPTTSKPKKVVATVLIATVALVAVPAANAGVGTAVKKPTKQFVPKPGWEVDSIGYSGLGRR